MEHDFAKLFASYVPCHTIDLCTASFLHHFAAQRSDPYRGRVHYFIPAPCFLVPRPSTPTPQTSVTPASSSNPGIPPSSLMSFLRINPRIAGVVLTEFDRSYSNPFQGSRFDNGSRVDVAGIQRTAALLAVALHRWGGGLELQVGRMHSVSGGLVALHCRRVQHISQLVCITWMGGGLEVQPSDDWVWDPEVLPCSSEAALQQARAVGMIANSTAAHYASGGLAWASASTCFDCSWQALSMGCAPHFL